MVGYNDNERKTTLKKHKHSFALTKMSTEYVWGH